MHKEPERNPRKVLGKGLSALLPTRSAPTPDLQISTAAAKPALPDHFEEFFNIPLDQIHPGEEQPRDVFDTDKIQELSQSIRAHGVLQPIVVYRDRDNRYRIIAGERRWRAARLAGLAEIPALVRTVDRDSLLELSLIENIQREDLNPIEEALAFSRLAREFGLRQEDIAQKVGKSRAAVANCMRLLELHPDVQSWLAQDRISVGHAKVLLSLKTPEEQILIAEIVIRQGHTVRATEKLVASHFASQGSERPTRSGSNGSKHAALTPHLQNVQNRLQQHLATHVVVQHAEKRGRIEIEYYGKDDLQRILDVLGIGSE